jgi:hypothetical protein
VPNTLSHIIPFCTSTSFLHMICHFYSDDTHVNTESHDTNLLLLFLNSGGTSSKLTVVCSFWLWNMLQSFLLSHLLLICHSSANFGIKKFYIYI